MNSTPLKGRKAIVTGGVAGIGLSIALELSRQGASVVVGSRRGDDVEPEKLGNFAQPVLFAGLDVGDADSVSRFMMRSQEFHGDSDILVNNAGVSVHHLVEGHSEDDWNRVININLNGPFRMIRACIASMKRAGWGRIVNIASTAARTAEPTHGAYCASKAGLVGLSRAVAKEGAPHGISCVCVSPTWVETDMLRNSARVQAEASGRTYEEEIQLMCESIPQGRLVQPQEIASLVAFACTDAAPALTMEDIQVNAGAMW